MGYLSIKSLGNAKDLQHFQGIMENKKLNDKYHEIWNNKRLSQL